MGAAGHAEGMMGSALDSTRAGGMGHACGAEGSDRLERAAVCKRCSVSSTVGCGTVCYCICNAMWAVPVGWGSALGKCRE